LAGLGAAPQGEVNGEEVHQNYHANGHFSLGVFFILL